MILDKISNGCRYLPLNPGFAKAFEFLASADLTALPEGRNEIAGDQVYAMVMTSAAKGRNGAKFEAHRRYIDIQVAVDGTDVIGWAALDQCTPRDPFNPEKDVEFLHAKNPVWVDVQAGCFAVYFPEDVHAPCAFDSGQVRKVVVKVAVEG